MEIEVSRLAKRFIAKRCEGSVYISRYRGAVPAWLEEKESLQAEDTPPAGDGQEFWRHDVDGIGVFVAGDVVPPGDSDVLWLDHRRRPRQRIVATWATRSGGLRGLRDVVDQFGWILWPR